MRAALNRLAAWSGWGTNQNRFLLVSSASLFGLLFICCGSIALLISISSGDRTFDPNSFSQTTRWLFRCGDELYKHRDNEIAVKDAQSAMRAEFAKFEGREVDWALPVESVRAGDGGRVEIRISSQCHPYSSDEHLRRLQHAAAAGQWRDGDMFFVEVTINCGSAGLVVTDDVEAAKKLRAGSTVRVKARVVAIGIERTSRTLPSYGATIRLAGCKVVR